MRKYLLLLLLVISTNLYSQKPTEASVGRIETRIREISQFGAIASGGVNRVAYSDADIKARLYVVALMKNAGLEVTIDQAANIIGRRKGKAGDLPYISLGSHIDSVPGGGNYDGIAGVLAAIECIELLNEIKLVTDHPLEVIVFTDEEGGLIGSMAMNGTITEKDLDRISNSGKKISKGIEDLGGNIEELGKAVRKPGEIAAFLELHIEQGAILDSEGTDIGVVEGIVGIETWEVAIEGKANHAGTTPMNVRQDALIAASKLVIAVNESVNSFEGSQVGTVGKIKVEPGASNVVPGKVILTIELRDLSGEKIMMVFARITDGMKAIEKETGTKISFRPDHSNVSALMDGNIMDYLTKSSVELGFSYRSMPSGAGHDAQDMSKIAPTGMVFVPSRNGISHSPLEYTAPEQIAHGASVLFHTVLKIDSKSRGSFGYIAAEADLASESGRSYSVKN